MPGCGVRSPYRRDIVTLPWWPRESQQRSCRWPKKLVSEPSPHWSCPPYHHLLRPKLFTCSHGVELFAIVRATSRTCPIACLAAPAHQGYQESCGSLDQSVVWPCRLKASGLSHLGDLGQARCSDLSLSGQSTEELELAYLASAQWRRLGDAPATIVISTAPANQLFVRSRIPPSSAQAQERPEFQARMVA